MSDILHKHELTKVLRGLIHEVEADNVRSLVVVMVDKQDDIHCAWSASSFLERVGLCESVKHNMIIANGRNDE